MQEKEFELRDYQKEGHHIYSELTDDIRVEVLPRYIPERSLPEASYYFFAYSIRITNIGPKTVRLLNRHWIIRDGHGMEEHVRGEGVVGKQPSLGPNQNFQYTSFCPLKTPTGSMRGSFEVVDEEGKTLQVVIPLFFLRSL